MNDEEGLQGKLKCVSPSQEAAKASSSLPGALLTAGPGLTVPKRGR